MKEKKDALGYSPENARSAEQAENMIEAAKEKRCVFCDISLEINKPLNKLGEFDPEGKDWERIWVWENPFPQENQSRHIMFIPKRHIDNENWDEITELEWLDILDAWKWAQKFYNIPGGGFVGRFGLRSHNAGTVGHLHFQLQIPDLSGNVKATFCKDRSPENEIRRANREARFNEEYTGFIYTIADTSGKYYLTEHLRWKKFESFQETFVHPAKANDQIVSLLKNWDEAAEVTDVFAAKFEKNIGITYISEPLDLKY